MRHTASVSDSFDENNIKSGAVHEGPAPDGECGALKEDEADNKDTAKAARAREIPEYTKGEEIFNMVSHIVGAAVGIVATVLCVIFAAMHRDPYAVVSSAIFGASMIFLYTMSSIYHGLSKRLAAKWVFRVMDHCTIFVLIAGTYTPLALCSLREADTALGWTVFGVIWGMASLGVVLNAINLQKFKLFSMVCYLGMGWCIVFTWKIVTRSLGTGGTVLLLAGGIAYTVGAIFYAFGKKHKYIHSVFHVFCVIGSILHALCIMLYVV